MPISMPVFHKVHHLDIMALTPEVMLINREVIPIKNLQAGRREKSFLITRIYYKANN